MSVSLTTSPILVDSFDKFNKINERRNKRNFNIFLQADLSPNAEKQGERLILVKEEVEGKAFQVLQRVNFKTMGWKEYGSRWFRGEFNIEKIGQFVQNNLKNWHPENPQQSIDLERQFAWLTQKCKESNIILGNPFQKTLKVVVRYFDFLQINEYVEKIPYDRLTPQDELSAKIDEILSRHVTFKIFTRTKIGGEYSEFPVTAAPHDIFQKIIRQPPNMFDPYSEDASTDERVVRFILQNPDRTVINHLILQEGRKEMPINNEEKFTFLISEAEKKKLLETLTKDLETKISSTMPKITLKNPPSKTIAQTIVAGGQTMLNGGQALLAGGQIALSGLPNNQTVVAAGQTIAAGGQALAIGGDILLNAGLDATNNLMDAGAELIPDLSGMDGCDLSLEEDLFR